MPVASTTPRPGHLPHPSPLNNSAPPGPPSGGFTQEPHGA